MSEIINDSRVITALIALSGVLIGGIFTFLLTWFKDSHIEKQKQKEKEKQFKREKLEQYLMYFYETKENMSKQMHRDFFYTNEDYDELVEAKLSILHTIHLKELDKVHKDYLTFSAEFSNWLAVGQEEQLEQLKKGVEKPTPSSEHMKEYPRLLNELNNVTLTVEKKIKEISSKL